MEGLQEEHHQMDASLKDDHDDHDDDEGNEGYSLKVSLMGSPFAYSLGIDVKEYHKVKEMK